MGKNKSIFLSLFKIIREYPEKYLFFIFDLTLCCIHLTQVLRRVKTYLQTLGHKIDSILAENATAPNPDSKPFYFYFRYLLLNILFDEPKLLDLLEASCWVYTEIRNNLSVF